MTLLSNNVHKLCALPPLLICASRTIQASWQPVLWVGGRRAIGAGALILAMSSQVQAASEPGLVQRISCSEVRYYVEKYTAAVAEMYARSHGATEAQIDRARRCLAGSIYRRAERWRTYTE